MACSVLNTFCINRFLAGGYKAKARVGKCKRTGDQEDFIAHTSGIPCFCYAEH